MQGMEALVLVTGSYQCVLEGSTLFSSGWTGGGWSHCPVLGMGAGIVSVWVTKRRERWSVCVLEDVRTGRNGREMVKSGPSIRGSVCG